MQKSYSERQVDHLLALINDVDSAHDLVCQLGLQEKKNAMATAEKLLAVREEDGAIWSMTQIEEVRAAHPKFFSVAFDEARHPFFMNVSSTISVVRGMPSAITFGVFFEIKWAKWPKKWGDVRSHFALEVFFKQRELQDRLDRAEREIKNAESHLKDAKKNHPNDPDHRDVTDANYAVGAAKARKKAIEREVDQLKGAMAKGDHTKAWKIVKANIKAKLRKLRRELKGVTGDTDKDKAKRAELNKAIAGHEAEIANAEEDVEKIK
jgi:hypothetical protein